MFWSWAFLAVTCVGAWFTFNAWLPARRQGVFGVPSFFAGWLTSELAGHHFAWQVGATVFFVWMGALQAWPGWVGLGITVASWLALLALVPVAGRSRHIVERALRGALGAEYAERLATPLGDIAAPRRRHSRLAVPFLLYDRDVRIARNIAYAEDAGRRQTLDVYGPRNPAQGAPVLLQIHGGGWVIGHKRQQALPLMLHLAARGWVCVAANYRLAPRATFPDPLVDLKMAIRWIRAHVGEYGGNPEFLAVTGGSAGGHLSSLVALTANDPAYQSGFEDVDTRVDACVPFYGVYDFTNRFGQDPKDGMRPFLERVVMKKRYRDDPEAFERASPVSRIHPDAPPFFVVHGTHDTLVPVTEAREFVRLLRATSKQPVAYAELPTAQHAFEVFHSLRTRHVVEGVERFLTFLWARHLEERGRAA
ncbi:MAG: alpha/beta hydrolase [Deltaproteobacteria bacterium]|nr:alpha/beta hydrolase [Deltaproteobacteria bacterium]